MKKIISVLLALTLSISFATLLISCNEDHEHKFSEKWNKDETHHWHDCEDEKCPEVSDKAEHVWDEGRITTETDADKNGEKTYTCTVCGAIKGEPVVFNGINKEKWENIVNDELIDNLTLGYNATFTSGYDDVGPHIGIIKLAGNKVDLEGEVSTDPENIAAVKDVYIKTSFAMIESFDNFEYDKENDVYSSKEDVVYNVSVFEYNAKITAKSISVKLDQNHNISKIICNMTQEFDNYGTPTRYVLDVEFSFSDYGTTVVE